MKNVKIAALVAFPMENCKTCKFGLLIVWASQIYKQILKNWIIDFEHEKCENRCSGRISWRKIAKLVNSDCLLSEHLRFINKSWKIELLTLNMKNVKIDALVAFLDGKLQNLYIQTAYSLSILVLKENLEKSNFRLWTWKMWKSLLWSHFLTENRKTCKFELLIVWASQV